MDSPSGRSVGTATSTHCEPMPQQNVRREPDRARLRRFIVRVGFHADVDGDRFRVPPAVPAVARVPRVLGLGDRPRRVRRGQVARSTPERRAHGGGRPRRRSSYRSRESLPRASRSGGLPGEDLEDRDRFVEAIVRVH
jgi:hypothetical protein